MRERYSYAFAIESDAPEVPFARVAVSRRDPATLPVDPAGPRPAHDPMNPWTEPRQYGLRQTWWPHRHRHE